MNEELTSLIIKELRRHRALKVIIAKVCARGQLNWKQAEQLVLLVEAQQKRTIAVQQTPPLLFLSIVALLLGISLLAFNLQSLVFFPHSLQGPIWDLQRSSYRIVELIIGLGITMVGTVGLWKAFKAIFPE